MENLEKRVLVFYYNRAKLIFFFTMFYRSSCYALMVSAVMMTGTVSAQSINSNDDNDNSVAVGYGTMKTEDITGSVSSVKMENLGKVANANALLGLQAKVPGMDIQQVSGEAGAGISMLLRKIGRAHV